MRFFGHHIDRTIVLIFLTDAAILALAFYGAYFARWADPSAAADSIVEYSPKAVLFTAITLVSMISLGAYERAALVQRGTIVVRMIAAFAVAVIAMTVVFYAIPDLIIWRSGMIIAVPVALGCILVVRLMVADSAIAQRFARRSIWLSAGDDPQAIDRVMSREGVATVNLVDRIVLNEARSYANDPHWLLNRVKQHNADEIIVQSGSRSHVLPIEALRLCRLRGCEVHDFASFVERETGRVDLSSVGADWLIFAKGFTNSQIDQAAKRIFDLLVASSLLVIMAPVMCIAALIIKWQDGGDVIFKQERVGLQGRSFILYKLRSMREDAEASGPQFATDDDPRVTAFGRFLRRTRIDELPQLFNVLKGEMSFVGPRPERPRFVEELTREIPFFGERHMVKPGLSGWAQINAPYASDRRSMQLKLEYDIFYVKNASVFLDLIVLAQTLRVVVWGNGGR